MKSKISLLTSFLICSLATTAQIRWGAWEAWGEQTDGTYCNPVVPADYSDLDCIRVGDDYYAISSTMQFSPGMTVLHSRDLVNWEIAGHAVPDLTQISPAMGWQRMDRYGRGIWAGSLRYHKGRFYVFFGTPDEGFFMTSAPAAEGPWEPLTPLLAEKGWDDCSAIWDERGRGWFVGTHFADGYKTYLFRMAEDGRSIDRRSARLINEGNHREASKLLYHDGYYYLIFSEHRDGIGRYVMARRDKRITGRFKEERQLLLPCREANEPNQGGIVEGPDGRWYFLTHHGSGDWSGRIISLLPVEWRNGWPLMGDTGGGVPGTMVWRAPMPALLQEKLGMQRGDDFESSSLASCWQWNYQPRADKFSLTERPGWLRLYAFRPLADDRLLKAGNTLTQRVFRSAWNEVVVRMDISRMADGQHAGLCHFAQHSGALGVVHEGGQVRLELRRDDRTEPGPLLTGPYLWLRSTWGLDGLSHFAYSTDGRSFTPFGDYTLSWGFYRGDRIGIYCYNNRSESGYIDVDYLHYDMKKQRPENPFGHSLVPDMIADASIQWTDSLFYCYATTDGYGQGLKTSGPPVVWTSKDFVHWQFDGTCFPSADGQKYWAPSKAVAANGRWYIYPTVNGIMHVGVADRPEGPFRLACGEDKFVLPYAAASTLIQEGDRQGIDAEVFVEDGQAYVFWGRRHAARLTPDMLKADSIRTLETRRKEYSEGPIFFKRNGIYYYLYTIGGDERYEYYYMMSRHSPFGPYETPAQDRVSTTSVARGVFGPGHGCVFNVGDDYYFAFLEFGRNSTNRQTYVNRLLFNEDGTIRPVEVSLDGVGALQPVAQRSPVSVKWSSASSVCAPQSIRHFKDERCRRTEYFMPEFAFDGANGSRWMAAENDSACWLMADLGTVTHVGSSELCFVRPTQGHAYVLEGSVDGLHWQRCGGQEATRRQSPHTDGIGRDFRFLRVNITQGVPGVWEWRVYKE